MPQVIDNTEVARPSRASVLTRRAHVSGKFLFAGTEKLYVKGVTYGSFPPDAEGFFFPSRETVERDFERMAAAGFNSIRVYTPPPVWLLDLAAQNSLYVMVGIGW